MIGFLVFIDRYVYIPSRLQIMQKIELRDFIILQIGTSDMQRSIKISTHAHNGLYDLTREVEAIVAESGVQTGLVNVYVQGATAGIMIQENWDDSVQRDVVSPAEQTDPFRGVGT